MTDRERMILRSKTPAHNKQFGVRRGVCSPKRLWDFGCSPPVRAFAFPRPTPSCVALGASRQRQCKPTVSDKDFQQQSKTCKAVRAGKIINKNDKKK
jgi:hypothetical protein